MQVKGQELPMHEPRGKWGIGLGYAVNAAGADHLVFAHDPCFEMDGEFLKELKPLGDFKPVKSRSIGEEKVRLDVTLQKAWSLYNVLGLCIFVGVPERAMFTYEKLCQIINSSCEWDVTIDALMLCSEKSINLSRIYNLREGLDEKDDTLPDRFFEEIPGGPLKGAAIPRDEFQQALKLFYKMRGWDESGKPTAKKLKELNISWAG